MKPHQCSICEKTFLYKSNLTAHIQRVHEEKKKQCAYCDHGYFENRRLLQHIAKVHNGKKQELKINASTSHIQES